MTPIIGRVGTRVGVIQDGCVLRTFDHLSEALIYIRELRT